jgi:hypothetical protein
VSPYPPDGFQGVAVQLVFEYLHDSLVFAFPGVGSRLGLLLAGPDSKRISFARGIPPALHSRRGWYGFRESQFRLRRFSFVLTSFLSRLLIAMGQAFGWLAGKRVWVRVWGRG